MGLLVGKGGCREHGRRHVVDQGLGGEREIEPADSEAGQERAQRQRLGRPELGGGQRTELELPAGALPPPPERSLQRLPIGRPRRGLPRVVAPVDLPIRFVGHLHQLLAQHDQLLGGDGVQLGQPDPIRHRRPGVVESPEDVEQHQTRPQVPEKEQGPGSRGGAGRANAPPDLPRAPSRRDEPPRQISSHEGLHQREGHGTGSPRQGGSHQARPPSGEDGLHHPRHERRQVRERECRHPRGEDEETASRAGAEFDHGRKIKPGGASARGQQHPFLH